MKKYFQLFATFIWAAYSVGVSASDWELIADESRVSFVSVKADIIGETHYFSYIEGSVSAAGDIVIQLPLESVETAIDIRNDRMREFLFETVNFPAAIITSKINPADFSGLTKGKRSLVTLSAQLDFHGVTSDLEFDVFVTRILDNKVSVNTTAPILIDADEFELSGGLDTLKELAGLDKISPIVPVTVSLVFER